MSVARAHTGNLLVSKKRVTDAQQQNSKQGDVAGGP